MSSDSKIDECVASAALRLIADCEEDLAVGWPAAWGPEGLAGVVEAVDAEPVHGDETLSLWLARGVELPVVDEVASALLSEAAARVGYVGQEVRS